MRVQSIEVVWPPAEPLVYQLLHQLLPNSLETGGRKVLQGAIPPTGACRAAALKHPDGARLVRGAQCEGCVARWAALRGLPRRGPPRPPLRQHARDLRDDVAAALDDDRVAVVQAECLRVVRVVEGRAADGDARDDHRLHHRDRDDDACQARLLSVGSTAWRGALWEGCEVPGGVTSCVGATFGDRGCSQRRTDAVANQLTHATHERSPQQIGWTWCMANTAHAPRPASTGDSMHTTVPPPGTPLTVQCSLSEAAGGDVGAERHTRSADGELHFPQLRDRDLGSRLHCDRPLGVRVVCAERLLFLHRRPRSPHILTSPAVL